VAGSGDNQFAAQRLDNLADRGEPRIALSGKSFVQAFTVPAGFLGNVAHSLFLCQMAQSDKKDSGVVLGCRNPPLIHIIIPHFLDFHPD
jgi:hypothetical protein